MRKLKFLALVAVVIGIGLLHFFTPGNLVFYHDTYRRLSYFPIVLGAIWLGVPGGLALAALSSVAFIPHLLLFIGAAPETYLSELTEIVLYLAAGSVTGFIAGREARLREQYRLISEKLQKSYDRLHEQTTLLLEVEEQLSASQRLSALGQLSASLAHEIKNPLGAIKGTAEILLDDLPPGHPKREFAEILIKEVARLNSTVEEILQYSRGRRPEAEKEPLREVVARVAKLLESQLKKKYIEFSLETVPEADAFRVEGGRLAQVFLNLILNAIAAVPERGRISVRMSAAPDGLAVAVADSGPGIPAEERELIFAPFFSRREEGTGLGLSISRKIVASYGGRIDLDEAPEGGARFTVFLPREAQEAVP